MRQALNLIFGETYNVQAAVELLETITVLNKSPEEPTDREWRSLIYVYNGVSQKALWNLFSHAQLVTDSYVDSKNH